MILALAIILALGLWPATDKGDQPRISATDSAYLGCSAWTGKEWTKPSTRSARTQVMESPKGLRAYGEVKAIVKGDDCENTTNLYVSSSDGSPYRIAYTVAATTSEGNGIRLVGWSPSGEKLLAEVNLWEYETDGGFAHLMVVYDSSTGEASQTDPDKALSRHFGSGCEFEHSVEAWSTNEKVLLKVSKSPLTESYEQHFCVNTPQRFLFDLKRQSLQIETEEHRKAN